MNKKITLLFGICLFGIGLALAFYKDQIKAWFGSSGSKGVSSVPQCPGDTVVLEMKEKGMAGLIDEGQKFKVVMGWYGCHPVERGDWVFYRYAQQRDPVVRVVRGIPGDTFELVKDKVHKAWNIKINGKIFVNHDQPVYFGSENPSIISLYAKDGHGLLAPGTFLVFADAAPGMRDSASFGVVSSMDFIGRVEKPEGKPKS